MIGQNVNQRRNYAPQSSFNQNIILKYIKLLDAEKIPNQASNLEFLFCYKGLEIKLIQNNVAYLIHPHKYSTEHIMSSDLTARISLYKERVRNDEVAPAAGLNFAVDAPYMLDKFSEVKPDGLIMSQEDYIAPFINNRTTHYKAILYYGRSDAAAARRRRVIRNTTPAADIEQAFEQLEEEIRVTGHPYARPLGAILDPTIPLHFVPVVPEYTQNQYEEKVRELENNFTKNMNIDLKNFETEIAKVYQNEVSRINKSFSKYNDDCSTFVSIVLNYFDSNTKDSLINFVQRKEFRGMIRFIFSKFNADDNVQSTINSFMTILNSIYFNESEIQLTEFLKFFETIVEIINSSNTVINDEMALCMLQQSISKGSNRYKQLYTNLCLNSFDEIDLNVYTQKLLQQMNILTTKSQTDALSMANYEEMSRKLGKKYKSEHLVSVNAVEYNTNRHLDSGENSKTKDNNFNSQYSQSQVRVGESCKHCGKTNHHSYNCFRIFKCGACDKTGSCTPNRCHTIYQNINNIKKQSYKPGMSSTSSVTSNLTSGTPSTSTSSSNIQSTNSSTSNISLADQFKSSHARPRHSN